MKSKQTTFAFALVSMLLIINLSACAQNKGNNNSSSTSVRNYTINNFNSIKSHIVGSIIFTQEDQFSIRAEGKQSEIDNIEITSKDGELIIESKVKNQKGKNNLQVYISAPNLIKIENKGVGNFTFKDKVSIDYLEIEYEGVGNMYSDNLVCENIKIKCEGVGNLNIKGTATNAEFISEGVGKIDAKSFDVDNLIVNSSGVGNILCKANKTIEISSDGVGSISYWGKPVVKKINNNGLGSIKQKD